MTRPVLKPVRPSVSDHALVRFLHRSGMEVEAVRAALEKSLADAHGAAIALGGADHMIVADKLSYVVRGGVVVTVILEPSLHAKAKALMGPTR